MKTVSIFLVAMLLLAGCIAPIAPVADGAAGSTVPAPAAQTRISDAQLANASYTGIYTYTVTLSDGEYQGEPFVEGGVTFPYVGLYAEMTTHGDLNGDGVDDAVVVLTETSGGSGHFSYLSAQLQADDSLVDAGAVLLGDRVGIESITIADGVITVEMVTAGPEDPLCCPTLLVANTYAVQDGVLVQTGSEELGTVSS